jgi:small subunit ribosomal protein S2e
MAEASGERGRGGFGRGRGRGDRGRGDRGRGRGRGRGARGAKGGEKEGWTPVTKLGRLVKEGKFKTMEEVFLYSLPVKEPQIIDFFFPESAPLKDEVMKIMPVQKQTTAGQRTRFKAFVAVGDCNGHIGLGVKVAAEVANAIQGAIKDAKVSLCPLRRGFWGLKAGRVHTVPMKLTGKCGSVRCRIIPAPRGTGLCCSPTARKMLTMAGIHDCYSSSRGHTRTTGNFIKAIYDALRSSYGYLSPDLWAPTPLGVSPIQQHSEFLKKKPVA